MNLRKPDRDTVADGDRLLPILVSFYDAIVELGKPLQPGRVPNLKSVTLSTYADLRKTPGDVMGELGPRLTMIAGGKAVLDGGQGVFVWDPTSLLADDGVNVIQAAAVNPGRWRRTAM